MPTPSPSLEQRIFQRPRDWQERYPGGDGPRDLELESDLHIFLSGELRRVAPLLPGPGPRANHPRADLSARFTEVLNTAFTRILEKYPDRLMRAQSRRQLKGYVSRTMSALMLNHYRRRRAFQKAIHSPDIADGHPAEVEDILSRLADERAAYFENRNGLPFSSSLELIHAWETSGDAEPAACGEALRLRYIDGLAYDDIAAVLNQSRDAVELLLRRGRYRLKTQRLQEP